MSTVLVTGGSGFVGSHVILQLLSAGHVVQTTVRSLNREESVRTMLRCRRRCRRATLGCPQLYFGVVDVRDVADLHLRAMTDPAAKGERFIAVSGEVRSMLDIARVLKARLGDAAKKVPTRQLPNWLVRVVALFDPSMKQLLPLLGSIRNATCAKAERLLGWKPRPREDAIIATAESLVKFGIVK
jgi:nucleoside-diphosphate-sugar epimerase